jgi:WD40 repeat protein/tRNA A-37 threonylcarbamoyl transferase component Bud32
MAEPTPSLRPSTADHAAETGSLPHLTPLPAARPGSMDVTLPSIPGYELLEVLGKGGMGVVYKARHLQLNRLVALKMILNNHFADDEQRQRFHREAEAVARLRHPHIVQIYDIGNFQNQPYFALEFCDGGSLRARIKEKGPLLPGAAARLVEMLARAVDAAHQNLIVHRDLKPDNVLLSADQPKITDFGLAKKLDNEPGAPAAGPLTQTGAIMGTPGYMAPEQARGERVGPAADMYALGVILYELLTGRPPFVGNLTEILRGVLFSEPAPPRRLRKSVPRDLETICLKCLHKDPAARYASADALAEDLRRFQTGEPIVARRVGRFERTVKWCWRHPAQTAAAALAVLLLVVLGVGTVIASLWQDAELARDRAETEQRKADVARDDAENARRIANAQRDFAQASSILSQSLLKKEEEARKETQRANKELAAAKAQQLLRSEWLDYESKVTDGQRFWQERDMDSVRLSLAGCRWDFQGWEYNYLYTLLQSPGQKTPADVLGGHPKGVNSVAFSPDNLWVVTGSRDRTTRYFWQGQGKPHKVRPQTNAFNIVFSRDGKRLASVGMDEDLHLKCLVVDAATDAEVLKFEMPYPPGFRPFAEVLGNYGLAFSPDGKRIACGNEDGCIYIRTIDGDQLLKLEGHRGLVTSLAFSPDGKWLVSGSSLESGNVTSLEKNSEGSTVQMCSGFLYDRTNQGAVKLWDAASGKEILTLPGQSITVRSVAFSPDGKRIVSGNGDGTLKIWQDSFDKLPTVLKAHALSVTGVAFSPDGKRIVSGSADKTVKVWDTETGQHTITLQGHTGAVTSVAFSKDGTRIASGSADKTVRVWAAASAPSTFTLSGHDHWIMGVAFSPDRQHFATASKDQTVKIWDAVSGQELHTLRGSALKATAVMFSSDGQQVACGKEKTVEIWDVKAGTLVTTIPQPDLVWSLAWSPNGKTIACACEDGTVRLMSADGSQPPLILKGHSSRVTGVAFNRAGTRLVSCSSDKTLIVWDAQAGRKIKELPGHEDEVNGVAFATDGRVASGGRDGTVRVWDPEKGEVLATFRHGDEVNTVAFSPDGRWIASGGADKTIKLWLADSKLDPLVLSGHPDGVWCLDFSPDGRRIISGGDSGVVMIWLLDRFKSSSRR